MAGSAYVWSRIVTLATDVLLETQAKKECPPLLLAELPASPILAYSRRL